jgi:hypothetical protein
MSSSQRVLGEDQENVVRFNEKNRLMTVLPGNAAGMVGVERLQDRFQACVGTMCASLEGLFTRLSLGFFWRAWLF